MAATQDILRTQLRFVFDNGIDGKGRMILKNKNYNFYGCSFLFSLRARIAPETLAELTK